MGVTGHQHQSFTIFKYRELLSEQTEPLMRESEVRSPTKLIEERFTCFVHAATRRVCGVHLSGDTHAEEGIGKEVDG
jgi:hypothetical protein